MKFKLYEDMTPAERAAIDADEDRREARKAAMSRGLDDAELVRSIERRIEGEARAARALARLARIR